MIPRSNMTKDTSDDGSASSISGGQKFYNEDGHSEFEFSGDAEEERDEVQEVKKMAQKDTTRVVFWRYVVSFITTVVVLYLSSLCPLKK